MRRTPILCMQCPKVLCSMIYQRKSEKMAEIFENVINLAYQTLRYILDSTPIPESM